MSVLKERIMVQNLPTWLPANQITRIRFWHVTQIVAPDLHAHAGSSHPNRLGILDWEGKTPRSGRM